MRVTRHWPRPFYRVWLYIYIDQRVKPKFGEFNFFAFRLNSKNPQNTINSVTRWGYKINAVYLVVKNRQNLNVEHSERLM